MEINVTLVLHLSPGECFLRGIHMLGTSACLCTSMNLYNIYNNLKDEDTGEEIRKATQG